MASIPGKFAPSNGSIYVCNLPYGTDDNMLAEYFGTIGVIKVWILQLSFKMMLCKGPTFFFVFRKGSFIRI
jgi:RNA recognition motif-containing protein